MAQPEGPKGSARLVPNFAKMASFLSWFSDNYRWLFDGAGVVVGLSIVGWAGKSIWSLRSAPGRQMIQRSGHNSINIQAGRDIHRGGKDE